MTKSILALIIILSSIGFGTLADARQGCGWGRHFCYKWGYCVWNGVCRQYWYHGPRYMPFTGRYVR